MGSVVLLEDAGARPRLQTHVGGELVSKRRNRFIERTVVGRRVLALRRGGGEERNRAVVSAHHEVRRRISRRHQRDREWLAGKGFEAPARLGWSQRRRV